MLGAHKNDLLVAKRLRVIVKENPSCVVEKKKLWLIVL